MSQLDLTIYVGDTYEHEITWEQDGEPQPLTGWTGAAKLKTRVGGATLATFTVANTDATNGVFTISLSAAQSETLAGAYVGVWDAQFTHTDGRALTPAYGHVKIVQDVTP